MSGWIARLKALDDPDVALVTVLAASGSVPREAGAWMLVGAAGCEGTVGGGALELAASARARQILARGHGGWHRETEAYPLGPALAQCCGGQVVLGFEIVGPSERAVLADMLEARADALVVRPMRAGEPPRLIGNRKTPCIAGQGPAAVVAIQKGALVGSSRGNVPRSLPPTVARIVREQLAGQLPRAFTAIAIGDTVWLIEPAAAERVVLYLYGAGHVGRAVVHVLKDLPFDVHWVDVARTRFPEAVAAHARMLAAEDTLAIAAAAPEGAFHVVMTFSHALDEALVAAILRRGSFGYLGLIGSKTKRARFVQRLRRAGIGEAAIARLVCPIGIAGIAGKTPATIAIALAADLIGRLEAVRAAHGADDAIARALAT